MTREDKKKKDSLKEGEGLLRKKRGDLSVIDRVRGITRCECDMSFRRKSAPKGSRI